MSSRALRLSLTGLAFLFAGTELAGQRVCDITSSELIVIVSNPRSDGAVSYVTAPRFECDDGTRMQADSSVHFEATAFSQLFGNVRFRDDRKELNADYAQYFERVGRLEAQGSVLLVNVEDGSWFTGEDLVLLQEGDDRPEDDVTLRGGRPHASIVSKAAPDSTDITPGVPPADNLPQTSAGTAPYEVDADMIHLVGDRLFQARGRVEIRQETLQSYGDSLEFQQDIGWLTLFDNARILSQDTVSGDTLDVRGDTITMNLPDDQIEEIEARGRAHLLADDIDMKAPVIRLVFEEEELERVFAVRRVVEGDPPPEIAGDIRYSSALNWAQPEALAEDFLLTGDSIEASLPGGELERVFAAGTARGVSSARDSLNTDATDELFRYDWIEGDTIIATFSSASADPGDPDPGESVSADSSDPNAGDTDPGGSEAAEPRDRQLDLLIALGLDGRAKTFYREAPDSAGAGAADLAEPPPLTFHYVIGDEVRLFMKDGEVERMEVVNPTGVRLQPNGGVPPVAGPPAGPPAEPPNGPQAGNGGVR